MAGGSGSAALAAARESLRSWRKPANVVSSAYQAAIKPKYREMAAVANTIEKWHLANRLMA